MVWLHHSTNIDPVMWAKVHGIFSTATFEELVHTIGNEHVHG